MKVKICGTTIRTRGSVKGQNQADSVVAFYIDTTAFYVYHMEADGTLNRVKDASGQHVDMPRNATFVLKTRLYRQSIVKLRDYLNEVLRETRSGVK